MSEYKVVQNAQFSPTKCAFCGSHGGPFIDTHTEYHGYGHVYTLHAELEGGKLAPVFEALLSGWKSQGYDLVALREMSQSLDMDRLSRNELGRGEVPGRSGLLAVQGEEFLPEAAPH